MFPSTLRSAADPVVRPDTRIMSPFESKPAIVAPPRAKAVCPLLTSLNIPALVAPVKENEGADAVPAIPRASPVEITWNRSPDPTLRSAAGDVSPMPTLPVDLINILVSVRSEEHTSELQS